MAGLSAYTRTIPAGQTSKIGARGHFVMVKECSGDITVATSQNQVGAKSGKAYKMSMRVREKWRQPEEFDEVEIINDQGAEIVVVLLIGEGDYSRDAANTSVAASLRTTTWSRTVTEIQTQNSYWVPLLPANPARRRYRIFMSIDMAGLAAQGWAQVFGSNIPAHRYTCGYFSMTWPAVPADMSASYSTTPLVPQLIPGAVANSSNDRWRSPSQGGQCGIGGAGQVVDAARTFYRHGFENANLGTPFIAHIVLDRDGIWKRYDFSAGSVIGTNVVRWPIGSLVQSSGVAAAVAYPYIMLLEGEPTFDGNQLVFGAFLNVTANRVGQWSDWIESTDAVNIMVYIGSTLSGAIGSTFIQAQEEHDE